MFTILTTFTGTQDWKVLSNAVDHGFEPHLVQTKDY